MLLVIRMSGTALYLGGSCPPNMEAYLDSLLYRTGSREFDILTTQPSPIPKWLQEEDRLTIRSYPASNHSGVGTINRAYNVVKSYLNSHSPDEIRQITQPRWHAPGVVLGTLGHDISVVTRVSAAMFEEYRSSPSKYRAWVSNNVLGRTVFIADRIFTPKYGGVEKPWWSPAEMIIEPREVNKKRFDPSIDPLGTVFTQSTNRVLVVGRVSWQKGIDLIPQIARGLSEWEFAVIGSTRDTSIAKKVESCSNASLYGPVEYVEMPRLYASGDVLLSVSRLEWGGVSRAMLEGRAMGKPVVALDIDAAGEVADRVTNDDTESIITALIEVGA